MHIDQSPQIHNDNDWCYGIFGKQQTHFKILLFKLALHLEQDPAQYFNQYNKEQQFQLFKLWTDLVEFQTQNNTPPMLFKLAKHSHLMKKILLPTQRLDYLKWYVDTYLELTKNYQQNIKELTCPITWISGTNSKLYPIQGQKLITQQMHHVQHIF